MTLAPLLAGAAGVCAAAAIVDLAALRVARRRRRGRWARIGLAVLARVGRGASGSAPPRDLAARIAAAGEPLGLSVADVMALKGGAAVAGGIGALTAGALAPGRLGLVVLVAGPALGFVAPDLALRRVARRRAEAIALELADVAELLRVAVDAGLSPMRAVAEVGRRHPGLLAAELRSVAARVALGVPRAEALDRLAARAPVAGVHALVAALGRAERHGSPLGPALAALAAEARADRTRRVRDRAARAAPKIQLVVALLLVPAVLLMVGAALAAALL
ncbi:MAG TPA: type II secretion system F family protein [Solirubrobacteraceae bacterium]|nr:type II secretion system F family protein [Solirubrobacteraceae bacterium]